MIRDPSSEFATALNHKLIVSRTRSNKVCFEIIQRDTRTTLAFINLLPERTEILISELQEILAVLPKKKLKRSATTEV